MSMILKRIISCLITVGLTVAMLAGLTAITESKASFCKYKQFFDQNADFDVLFIGSSKVINGILPVELWNDYGIVSYNMGGHANTLPTSYWVLRNALEYTTPKCVVIDCHGSASDAKISSQFDYAHLSFDSVPLSLTKIQAVFDLVEPQQWDDYRARRMELLWNFSIYHSTWNEVYLGSFRPSWSYQKGAELRANVSVPAETETLFPDDRNTWDTLGMEYLIKSIKLCQERGIDVILIHLPYPAAKDTLTAANTVGDVAEYYGVEYLNFFTTDVVDYQTDMYDPDSHLNPSGAFKVTDCLGQILSERYDIPDRRNHQDYQHWYYDAEMYQQEKISLFETATSAWCYWMLLSDDDFSFVAELSENDLQQDEMLPALLRNAGIQPEKVNGRCIVVADRTNDTVTYIELESLTKDSAETSLGLLSCNSDSVMLDGQECWKIITGREPAMHFALLTENQELVGQASFFADEIRSKLEGD